MLVCFLVKSNQILQRLNLFEIYVIYALNPFFELFRLMMTNGKHSDEKDMYFILVVLQIYYKHTSSKQLLRGSPVMR